MSFWVSLSYEKEEGNAQVMPFTEGGTHVVGGSTDADLNVTYNYSPYYYAELNSENGLRWLHNKKASDTIDALTKAVKVLGIDKSADYWESTPGNAGYALSILLNWANQHPDAIWNVN